MFKKQKPADLPVPKIIKKPAPPPPVPPKESTELETTPGAENLNDEEKSTNEDKDTSDLREIFQYSSLVKKPLNQYRKAR